MSGETPQQSDQDPPVDHNSAGESTPDGVSKQPIDEANASDVGSNLPSMDDGDQTQQPSAELSPDDIDAMLASAEEEAEAVRPPESESAVTPPESSDDPAQQIAASNASAGITGDLSQEDIDAALADAETLAGESAVAADVSASPEPDESPKLDSSGRPFDEMAAMMETAIAEEKAAAGQATAGQSQPRVQDVPPPPPPTGSTPLELSEFEGDQKPAPQLDAIDLLNDVELDVKIELGRAEMEIEDVLALGPGGIVELNKLAGDPVDVLVNDRLVARGEVLVLNDNFCVRINEILNSEQMLEAEEAV